MIIPLFMKYYRYSENSINFRGKSGDKRQRITKIIVYGPPGHHRIDGHYFHTWCPYVRHKKIKKKLAETPGKENARYKGHHAWK